MKWILTTSFDFFSHALTHSTTTNYKHNSLTELYNYERFSAPYKRGDYYYFSRNTGLQAQSVLYQQDTIDSEPRVFLDPNTLEADGTAALSTHAFSKSGLLYGYAIAKSGSDWVTIYVMDNKGNKLEDVVEWAKFTNISFTHDDKGFYYGVSFFCFLLLL